MKRLGKTDVTISAIGPGGSRGVGNLEDIGPIAQLASQKGVLVYNIVLAWLIAKVGFNRLSLLARKLISGRVWATQLINLLLIFRIGFIIHIFRR